MLAAARRSVLKVPIRFTRTMPVYLSSEPGLPSFSTSRSGPPTPDTPPVTRAVMFFCSCMDVSPVPGLQAFDDGGVGHAAGLAHGLQAIARAAVLQRVQHGGHQADARGAQRMAQGDGAAARVQPLGVGAQFLLPSQRHGGKGLVDLA